MAVAQNFPDLIVLFCLNLGLGEVTGKGKEQSCFFYELLLLLG